MAKAKQSSIPFLGIILALGLVAAAYVYRKITEGFSGSGKVYVAYHIYCNSKTKPIVQEQVSAIIMSGLYEKVDAVLCFLVGEEKNISEIEEFLAKAGKKFRVAAKGPGDKTYERFTLLKLHEILNDGDKFLYIHSKGVSRNAEETLFWWRFHMQYYLMRNVDANLSALENYDILGVAYTENVPGTEGHLVGPHFSGNFWWSTGKYYKTLKREIGADYNDPEIYIFSGNPKYKMLDGATIGDRHLHSNPVLPIEYL